MKNDSRSIVCPAISRQKNVSSRSCEHQASGVNCKKLITGNRTSRLQESRRARSGQTLTHVRERLQPLDTPLDPLFQGPACAHEAGRPSVHHVGRPRLNLGERARQSAALLYPSPSPPPPVNP